MKMVSAAKLRRAQNLYGKVRIFAEKSEEILRDVVCDEEAGTHPLLIPRAAQKRV